LSPDLPSNQPLRIGFICTYPLENTNYLSGMPARMAKSLQAQGITIVPLIEHPDAERHRTLLRRILNRLNTQRRRCIPLSTQKWIDDALPARTRSRLLNQIRRRSAVIQSRIEAAHEQGEQLDALFGCCISSTLFSIQTKLPIIYFSDATSFLIKDTYVGLMSRANAYLDTLHEIEQISVNRANAAIFAAPITRDSAIHDLNIPPERAHVVPMGAHITPESPTSIHAPASPPTREHCNLLIVAAEPVRKRVDLAAQATEILQTRGINATLHIVGPGTQRSNSTSSTKPVGMLKLSDDNDRQTHQQLLRDCHLQLLPSLGEAFGIAPIESAHFARPSIVSNAGGLPFVVQHNKTGLVIDRDANATAWADAVESLIENPDHYRALSTAALERARAELNWDAWGQSVAQIIAQTIADQR